MPPTDDRFTQSLAKDLSDIVPTEVILSFSQCVTYYVDQAGLLWKSMEFAGLTRYAHLARFSRDMPVWVTCSPWTVYKGVPQAAEFRELSYYEYTQLHPAIFRRHEPGSISSLLSYPFP
jgi:hypothetical protein